MAEPRISAAEGLERSRFTSDTQGSKARGVATAGLLFCRPGAGAEMSGGGGVESNHSPEDAMSRGWVAALSLVVGVPILFGILVTLAKPIPVRRLGGIVLVGIGAILLILALSL
jgi:hypothetical protein